MRFAAGGLLRVRRSRLSFAAKASRVERSVRERAQAWSQPHRASFGGASYVIGEVLHGLRRLAYGVEDEGIGCGEGG
jgi:hypothetical protein